MGMVSSHASEQHELFFDYKRMQKLALQADLIIIDYKRFLLGANQLFILKKNEKP